MDPEAEPKDTVLIMAPLSADRAALESEIAPYGVALRVIDEAALAQTLEQGAELLAVTAEALSAGMMETLLRWSKQQPDWSALPVLALLGDPSRSPQTLRALLAAGADSGLFINILGWPAPHDLLRNAVLSCLQSRRRQYRIRDQIEELDASRRQTELLAREVQHRAKNNLARLHSILRQTRLSSSDPETSLDRFEERLLALARGEDILNERRWRGANLTDLVSTEIEAITFGGPTRLECDGVSIELTASAALALHLVFHELTTNASKYGALSVATGRIVVRWRLDDADDGARLEILWEESGGPPIAAPPSRLGFGSQLVALQLKHELNGAYDMDYRKEGFFCAMRLPLEGLLVEN